jgi:hypothetical protein
MLVHHSSPLLVGLVAIVCSFIPAQQVTEVPDIKVMKFSWAKVRVGWERDPFGGAVESYDEMRIRSRNEKRIEDAKKGGSATEIDKVKREARADAANIAAQRKKAPARYIFEYRVSIKNESKKTIKTVDWDYVFQDATSGDVMGVHEFTSEQRIGPGKTRDLKIQIRKPPAQIVSVTSLEKDERNRFKEQVIVRRIEFADGSYWQHP